MTQHGTFRVIRRVCHLFFFPSNFLRIWATSWIGAILGSIACATLADPVVCAQEALTQRQCDNNNSSILAYHTWCIHELQCIHSCRRVDRRVNGARFANPASNIFTVREFCMQKMPSVSHELAYHYRHRKTFEGSCSSSSSHCFR